MATAQLGPTPEFVLAYREMMIEAFVNELETTKKVLAAIPDARCDYRPDPHARSAWELAWHLAESDVDFLDGIADLKFSMEPVERKDKPGNVAELLAWYDKQVTRAINRVRGLNAQQLLTPVNFFGVFNLPVAFYLGFMNNHSVHHRGALATYLRPMGSKVPSIYGGSHDEPFQPQSSAA
ncbi:MAG TPA: DinB family protein [Terriglobales bacterium]|nr:DinB family protein [Terriglobales bacterium]